MIRHPWSWRSLARLLPTLPKPCTATGTSSTPIPSVLKAERIWYMTPRPVASGLPSEPPMETGLPVTTPGTEWPTLTE